MDLFYSPGASSLAVHIALIEARAPFRLQRVDLEEGVVPSTGERFDAVHSMGKVPVLRLDDGSTIAETLAILLFVGERSPMSSLVPAPGDRARYRMLEAMSFVATELHKGFAPMFDPTVPLAFKERLGSDSRPFERLAALVGPAAFVAGSAFTVADAHLFAILRLGRVAGLDFSRWPEVDRYFHRVASRPAVQEAMRAEGLLDPEPHPR